MAKRVTDITAGQLDLLAAEAWFEASKSALKAGVPVVGCDRDMGKIVRRHPDGRVEVLADAPPLNKLQVSDVDAALSDKAKSKRGRNIA
jgi:hypothetical protein